MKRIITSLITCLMLASLAHAQSRTVTVNDSINRKKLVIELYDTIIDGQKAVDTLSITTYEADLTDPTATSEADQKILSNLSFNPNVNAGVDGNTVAIIAIIAVFGMPVCILIVVFYFRHQQRKANYQLAEKILAAGQPLPENLFGTNQTKDLRSKGISNICLGLGLFIFLWALSDEFSIACIGLLILLTGVGQVIIYYTQQPQS